MTDTNDTKDLIELSPVRVDTHRMRPELKYRRHVRVFRNSPERVHLQIRSQNFYSTAALTADDTREVIRLLQLRLAEIDPRGLRAGDRRNRRSNVTTKLIQTRKPTPAEKKRGAEVVFIREGDGEKHTILACRCYESWEQWGARTEVLGDNVSTVERWRQRQQHREEV